jgi:hypothetical protein
MPTGSFSTSVCHAAKNIEVTEEAKCKIHHERRKRDAQSDESARRSTCRQNTSSLLVAAKRRRELGYVDWPVAHGNSGTGDDSYGN